MSAEYVIGRGGDAGPDLRGVAQAPAPDGGAQHGQPAPWKALASVDMPRPDGLASVDMPRPDDGLAQRVHAQLVPWVEGLAQPVHVHPTP